MNKDQIDGLHARAKEATELGDAARVKGHIKAAARHYETANKINLEFQDVISSWLDINVGDRFEVGIAVETNEREKTKLDVLWSQADEAISLGDAARKTGNMQDAAQHYETAYSTNLELQVVIANSPNWSSCRKTQVFQLYLDGRKTLVDESDLTRDEILERISSDANPSDQLINMAFIALEKGLLIQSQNYIQQAETLQSKWLELVGARPYLAETMSNIQIASGELAIRQNNLALAEIYYRRAGTYSLQMKERESSAQLRIIEMRLGNLAENDERASDALTHYMSCAYHIPKSQGMRPTDEAELLEASADDIWSSLGISPNELAKLIDSYSSESLWIADKVIKLAIHQLERLPQVLECLSDLSKQFVELLDLKSAVVSGRRMRQDFARFHRLYLDLALRHAPSELPRIVSAIQGRKLAALVLDEMEARKEEYPEGDLRWRFLEVRTELRRLAIGLQAIECRRGNPDDILPFGWSGKPELLKEAYQARVAEYEAKIVEYRQLRLDLSQKPGFAVAAPHLMEVDHALLQSTLAADEAIVLLLHVTPGTEDVQAVEVARTYALVIRAQGAPRLVELDKLLQAMTLLRQIDVQLGHRGGYRESGTGAHEPFFTVEAEMLHPAEAMESLMREALWLPLAECVQGINRLNLITHGELHALPVHLECPVKQSFNWPGLVFYHLHKEVQPPPGSSDTERVGILAYAASDLKDEALRQRYRPIPLVAAEAAMIEALWPGKTVNPLDLSHSQFAPVISIHLAAHGSAIEGYLEEAHLLVGADGQILTFHDVLGSSLQPDVVFLSACVVGQTKELDGDPLGLVSAFLLKGARFVVAPMVPVSDFLTPLLAVQFHQGLAGGLGPHQSLVEAKRRLRTGEWYEGTEELVRTHYTPVLARAIRAALAEGQPDLHKRLVALDEQILLWLPQLEDEHATRRRLVVYPVAEAYETNPTDDRALASPILDWLVANKASLPSRDITDFTIGFGPG